MSNIAGATTGCHRSLVDQMAPIILRSVNSGSRGKVRESGSNGRERPLARFFCIMTIFDMKVRAEVAVYIFVRENSCRDSAVMRGKGSSEVAATCNMCSIRMIVRT